MINPPPPAAGIRLPWSKLPVRVLAALEAWLDEPVAMATMQQGGFSPGVAARVRTCGGRRVFVKAVGAELNPDSPGIHRQEIRIMAELPASVPAPRLLWAYDEGENGWVMLVLEDIDGWNPKQPWHSDELDRVLGALVSLSTALTPPPFDAMSAREVFTSTVCGWQLLRQRTPDGLDEWSARHLTALAALESVAGEAAEGNTLLHLDIRADNILLTPNRIFVVDWPSACIGAAWIDLAAFAPSVAMQGGPSPEALLMRHPVARVEDPSTITAVVAALAGYFTQRALLPPQPGLPTLRAFQAAQGVEARKWLALRTGWT